MTFNVSFLEGWHMPVVSPIVRYSQDVWNLEASLGYFASYLKQNKTNKPKDNIFFKTVLVILFSFFKFWWGYFWKLVSFGSLRKKQNTQWSAENHCPGVGNEHGDWPVAVRACFIGQGDL